MLSCRCIHSILASGKDGLLVIESRPAKHIEQLTGTTRSFIYRREEHRCGGKQSPGDKSTPFKSTARSCAETNPSADGEGEDESSVAQPGPAQPSKRLLRGLYISGSAEASNLSRRYPSFTCRATYLPAISGGRSSKASQKPLMFKVLSWERFTIYSKPPALKKSPQGNVEWRD